MSTQAIKREKEFVALWARKSEKVERFYVGRLGQSQILVMPNPFKTPENKQPDFRVYVEPDYKAEGHQAFQTRIAALWANAKQAGEFKGKADGRRSFALRMVPAATKQRENQPDAVIYLV
jgi:hypothetical protein